jgi:hypothetical protein
MAIETQTVGRQNTIALTAGQQVAFSMSLAPGAGPGVFSWDLLNAGPSDIWARWDGQGDAAADDPRSVWLPAGVGYSGALTNRMTVAANAATTLVFAVNDRS